MQGHTIVDDFVFGGHQRPRAIDAPDGHPWRKFTTGAASVQVGSSGSMDLTLTAANEVQVACLYFGDVLSYDIDELVLIDFWVALSAGFPAGSTLGVGLATARSDDPEAIAAFALLKCVGTNNVVVSTDDGTIDLTDKRTVYSLSPTARRCSIDFGSGIQPRLGPTFVGGKADVRFSIDNAGGLNRRVEGYRTGGATSEGPIAFDMSNYSGGLQPFVQLQKTIGITTALAQVQRIRVSRRSR